MNGDPLARNYLTSESTPIDPRVDAADPSPLRTIESDLLARQIAALDGVSYEEAHQQIKEMMGFDLSGCDARPMTLYNQWMTIRPLRDRPASSPPAGNSAEEIARDLRAVGRIDAIPTLLEVLCETTGMRFAAVARVAEDRWIACAVKDKINLGLKAGSDLNLNSRLCIESQAAEAPIVIDQASTDPRYRKLHEPGPYRVESYISVPVILPGGRHFGNLCAIDPAPSKVSDPRTVSMFKRFAQLIGQQLDDELTRERQKMALHDERATSELREQFIAILGHDLRNPLHAISATADMLERRLDISTLAGMATRIKSNAQRMSSLIDDVLDFARARLGSGIGIEMEAIDNVADHLTAVVRELQDANPERDIQTDFRAQRRVYCDIGRVQQLASNLVANALTHGSAKGPVRVTAREDDECLTFSVWNDGVPIPASSINKVFEPFWRHTVSTSRQGLGLGLYICSQIVRAHEGKMSVISTQEGGTQFTVRLPIRRRSGPSNGDGSGSKAFAIDGSG